MTNTFSSRVLICFATTLLLSVCLSVTQEANAADDQKKVDGKKPVAKITYDEHIKPIFRNKCFGCHNPDGKKGDLDLTNFSAMMAGGGSGDVIEAGSAEDSYLYSLVTHDSEPAMPPKSDKLAAASLDLIKKWIDQGALENSSSKAKVNKPTQSFTLKSASSGRPAGAPPMPARMSLEPLVLSKSSTAITAIATSPWAPLAAVAGQKQVLLYNMKTLMPAGVFSFPEGTPYVLKFSRNGSLLLAGGGRGASVGKVAVWDVKTGKRLFTVGDELDCVMAADISSDQSLIALGGPHRVVRVYSTADGSLQYEIKKHTDWITTLEFSPDSVLLATGDRSSGLFVWEAQNGREYLNLSGHKGPIADVSWRSDSNIVASASDKDGDIKLWEMENGKLVKSWRGHAAGTADIEFCRDGKLVSCGRDRATRLWDQNGKALRTFPAFSDLALRVSFCDETAQVIAGDWTGKIAVWNSADGKVAGELSANPPTLAVRVETANQLVATATAELKKAELNLKNSEAAMISMKNRITQANRAIAISKTQMATADKNEKLAKPLISQTTQQLKKSTRDKAKVISKIAKQKQNIAAQQKTITAATTAAQAAKTALDNAKKALAAVNQKAAADKQTADKAVAVAKASAKAAAVAKSPQAAKDKAIAEKTAAAKLQTVAGLSAKAVPAVQATVKAAENTLSKKTVQQTALMAKLTAMQISVTQATNQLTALTKTVATLDQTLKTATKQLADATALKKTARATNKKSTADSKTLAAKFPPYVVGFNKNKAAVTAAQQKLAAATAAAKTWQDELAFASSQKKK